MVAQQVSTRPVTHQREYDVQLALVQERRHVRDEVRVHQLPGVIDLVLHQLTVGLRHTVQVEVLHGHQVAALVVLTQEHDGSVREARAQHRAHRVLLQVGFEVHDVRFWTFLRQRRCSRSVLRFLALGGCEHGTQKSEVYVEWSILYTLQNAKCKRKTL